MTRNDMNGTVEAVAKGASVWGLIKITSWADLSYALAAVYTAILIGHWVWKNVIKPSRRKRKESVDE